MSSAKRMLSNVAVHEALRPTDYAGKVPSHLRRKGSHGVRRERSISNGPGGRKTPTVVAGDKDYQNGGGALTDRGARAKTHLAAIAKQVSGSNYHAYKIDETPEEITCYLFQRRKASRGQGPTNPMGILGYSPTKMASHYRQSFKKAGTSTVDMRKTTGEAFNLEKEHKIINPHKMQLRTCNRDEFKEFKVMPNPARKQYEPPDEVPFPSSSTYKADFPDWKAQPHHIEKHPQYPVYSLPFKGKTLYNDMIANPSQRGGAAGAGGIEKYSEKTQSTRFHMGAPDQAIKGALYAPVRFMHQTTAQTDYKPFKIDATQRRQSREEVVARKNEAEILTKQAANPYHFKTSKGQDFKKLKYVMVTLDEDESVPPTPLLKGRYG